MIMRIMPKHVLRPRFGDILARFSTWLDRIENHPKTWIPNKNIGSRLALILEHYPTRNHAIPSEKRCDRVCIEVDYDNAAFVPPPSSGATCDFRPNST
jgi:hypothetical protein